MARKILSYRYLHDVPHDKKFYAWDGNVIKNLYEFQQVIRNMDSLTYTHHVNQDRNDFYNWVNEVIGDKHLASQLLQASSQNETISVVENKVNDLKKLMEVKKATPIKKMSEDRKPIKITEKTEPIQMEVNQMGIKKTKKSGKPAATKSARTSLKLKKSDAAHLDKRENIKETIHRISQPAHLYTNRQLILYGIKDFLLGLFIGIVATLIIINFIKFYP